MFFLKVVQNIMTGTVMVVINEKSIKCHQIICFFKFDFTKYNIS